VSGTVECDAFYSKCRLSNAEPCCLMSREGLTTWGSIWPCATSVALGLPFGILRFQNSIAGKWPFCIIIVLANGE
jgi:hypothetical protein